MDVIRGIFNEFEFFNHAVKSWDLDFTLLSKGGFYADFKMTNNNSISISKINLNGKILQHGLTPDNSVSFVIPNNPVSRFNWLNKNVNGSQLLVFPQSRQLHAFSFSDFDVYVFTISKYIFYSLIEKYELVLNKSFVKGDEQIIQMSKKEYHSLRYQANQLLRLEKDSGDIFDFLSKKLLESLLIFLSEKKPIELLENNSFRYSTLLKAIPIVKSSLNEKISITKLCNKLNVSERSLQYAFKDYLDITPVSFINSVRLHHAKKKLYELRHQKTSIVDIAAEFGFYHMGGFSKSFKDKFGILPSQIQQYP